MIVIVDDDEMLLELTSEMVRSFGYEVIAFTAGQTLLDIINELSSNVELAILDYSLGTVTANDIIPRLRGKCPKLPIIVYSGYSDGRVALTYDNTAFIRKPFQMTELRAAIARALENTEAVV